MTLQDFNFKFTGAGHYKVSYSSPQGKRQYSKTITDMTIIDRTKNAEEVKQKDLKELYRQIKN